MTMCPINDTSPSTRVMTDADYMSLALAEAALAANAGDVPVGAVIVRGHKIIAHAHNTREADQNTLGHAEMNAINEACRTLKSKWLADCTLYVTLEPCPMCTGAILQARIPRVVFGAKDPVAGAMGSVWALHRHPVDTRIQVTDGVLESACRACLQDFFRAVRQPEDIP